MLETQNLARKYASICSFRKYTFQCLGHLILLMPAFFAKNSVFCPKKYLYSRQQCESCVRDFLVLFSVFVRQKVTITKHITLLQTLCPESSLRAAPNWPKVRKMTMTSQFSDMTSMSMFFDLVLFLLPNLVIVPLPSLVQVSC